MNDPNLPVEPIVEIHLDPSIGFITADECWLLRNHSNPPRFIPQIGASFTVNAELAEHIVLRGGPTVPVGTMVTIEGRQLNPSYAKENLANVETMHHLYFYMLRDIVTTKNLYYGVLLRAFAHYAVAQFFLQCQQTNEIRKLENLKLEKPNGRSFVAVYRLYSMTSDSETKRCILFNGANHKDAKLLPKHRSTPNQIWELVTINDTLAGILWY